MIVIVIHRLTMILSFALSLATALADAQDAPRSCMVVIVNGTAERWAGSAEECATRLSPASTYKIPHALIGLETKVVGATTLEKWDGTKYPDQAKWNTDHTVLSGPDAAAEIRSIMGGRGAELVLDICGYDDTLALASAVAGSSAWRRRSARRAPANGSSASSTAIATRPAPLRSTG